MIGEVNMSVLHDGPNQCQGSVKKKRLEKNGGVHTGECPWHLDEMAFWNLAFLSLFKTTKLSY